MVTVAEKSSHSSTKNQPGRQEAIEEDKQVEGEFRT